MYFYQNGDYYKSIQIRMQQKKSQSSFAQIKSKIKVVFLGQQSTGKTSILMRFIHDKFEQGLGPTIGIDFMAKNLHVGHNILRMQLWDTAGQQRFRSLIPSYLKDALIAFIVFDLTNEKSFDNLNEWIDLCHNNKKEKTILVLLGNKSDLREQRQVPHDRVRAKIEETTLPYFEVSAKTGQNIKEAFNFAGNQYYNAQQNSAELTLSSFAHQKSKNEVIKEQLMEQEQCQTKQQTKSKKQENTKIQKKISSQSYQIKLGQTKKQKKEEIKKKRCC